MLAQQRALVKKLTERLADIGHEAGAGESEEESETEDVLDLLQTRSASELAETQGTIEESGARQHKSPDQTLPSATEPAESVPAYPLPLASPPMPVPTTTTTSTLRSREALLGKGPNTDASTTSASPFPSSKSPDLSSATATLLSSADSEQTDLTAAMLGLASALKHSAQTFAADLNADAGTLRATELALDKNKAGMQRTSGGLARLRRMSEGRWFATRLGMMVLIPLLWVVLLLEVFVMPKLRL